MAAFAITPKEELAEATIPGELYLVLSTTLSITAEKDQDHGVVHAHGGRV